MRSIKGVLVALVAVLAFGAVAASGASAHEYFIEGKSMAALGLSEETVTSKIGEATLSFSGVEVACAEDSGTGSIKQGGTGSMTLRLDGCSVARPANCSVKSIVLTNTADKLVEAEGKLADEFSPEKFGGNLFTMVFENSGGPCSAAGVWTAEGQITGRVGSEVEKEAGALNFTSTSGSKAAAGGWLVGVYFKDEIKLSGINKNKKWAEKK